MLGGRREDEGNARRLKGRVLNDEGEDEMQSCNVWGEEGKEEQ